MIEDYNMLSEEELLEDILQELEEETTIDAKNLDLNFEGGKLIIQGSLANEDDLEHLIGVLENHLESGDYELELDLTEGQSNLLKKRPLADQEEDEDGDDEEDFDDDEEDDDDADFVEDENYDDTDENDQW